MLKKILIGAGVLISVLVLSLVALAVFFDADKFKPEIERYVHERTKRTLKFEGKLALSVFPRFALALPRTTLSSLAGDRVSASLDGARVSVAILPLLRGRIEVGGLSIEGLRATVERRRDGTTSIDDLLSREPLPKATDKPPGTPAFEIGGIELANADLTLEDLEAGRTVRLAKLNLTTGRLAPVVRTPFQLETLIEASNPPASGQMRVTSTLEIDLAQHLYAATAVDASFNGTLEKQPIEFALRAERIAFTGASGGIEAAKLDARAKGTVAAVALEEARVLAAALAFDPMRKRLSVGGVEASAKGKATAGAFEATLTAPKLDVTEATASGQRAAFSAKLVPEAANALAGQVRLVLEGVSGNAARIDVANAALDGDVSIGARKYQAVLAGALTASLDARTLSLPRFAGAITLEDPALPQKSLKVPLTAKLAIDAKAERADAGFASKFDETSAAAEFTVRGFSAPRFTFEASADHLNVDRYFPPPPPRPGNDSADPKEDPKVDLSPIRNLNLTGSIRLGHVQARGIKAGTVDVGVKAANGRLDLAPITAQLYQGSLAGSANLIAEGNEVKLDTSLTNVAIEPLLKDVLERDLLEGRGNIRLAIDTAGETVSDLKRHLAGSASLNLRDGAVKGINLAAKLRDARALLAGSKDDATKSNTAEKTDFSELTATFAIKDGVAVSDDLDLKSPLLRVGGAGRIDVGAGTIDYTTRVSVVGTLKGQDGRNVDQLRGVTVPVKLSGPFETITWNIDWGDAAREALKSQAAQKLAPQLQAEKDKARSNVQQKAREALKGLLQR